MAGRRPLLWFLVTDAGGGHRASAAATEAHVRARNLPWDVRIVNVYREWWAGIEPLHRLTGIFGEDVYNLALRRGWFGITPFLRGLAHRQAMREHPAARRAAADALRVGAPDLCVSFLPFVNDVLAAACADAGVPFGLVTTDLMDTEPFMWFTPGAARDARFVTAGCDASLAQARAAGAGDRALRTGLVIHPRFTAPVTRALTRAGARAAFGLDPELPVVTVMTGGQGSRIVRDLVRAFDAVGGRWQVVAVCGRNEGLRTELERRASSFRNRVLPLGFTDRVPALLRASDVLVAKPGPATLTEALTIGVGLVLDAEVVMPQEAPNADWIERRGLGIAVRRRRAIPDVVRDLLASPSRLADLRARQASAAPEPAAPLLLGAIAPCLSASTPS